MSNLAKWQGTLAVLLLGLPQVSPASPSHISEAPRGVGIHIRLVDLASVPPKLRAQAETAVIAIFRRARVEVDFLDCEALDWLACRQDPAGGDFWLQILPTRPTRLQEDATGFAVLVPFSRPGDSYAAVSYPVVAEVAAQFEAPLSDVLAAAMAHEIGHLLLESKTHSASGIMVQRLDRRQILLMQRGELLFTREEAARLGERCRQLAAR